MNYAGNSLETVSGSESERPTADVRQPYIKEGRRVGRRYDRVGRNDSEVASIEHIPHLEPQLQTLVLRKRLKALAERHVCICGRRQPLRVRT